MIFSKPCLGICLILCLMFLSWFYGRSLNSFYVFSSDKYIVTHRRFCLAHSIFWFRFSIQIPFVKNTLSCPFFCFDFLLNLEGQVPQAKNNISQQRYAGSSQKAFYTFFLPMGSTALELLLLLLFHPTETKDSFFVKTPQKNYKKPQS